LRYRTRGIAEFPDVPSCGSGGIETLGGQIDINTARLLRLIELYRALNEHGIKPGALYLNRSAPSGKHGEALNAGRTARRAAVFR
jgi:hypothetical protein